MNAPAESRFFSLPLELRMLIYELVLVPGTAINLTWQINMNNVPNPSQSAQSSSMVVESPAFNVLKASGVDCALLRVCKLAQYEANVVFYSKSTFRIELGLIEYIPAFLTSIGERNSKLITRLEIINGSYEHKILRLYQYTCTASGYRRTRFHLDEIWKRLPALLELKLSNVGQRIWLFMMENLYRMLREIKTSYSTADKPSFKLLYGQDQNYVRIAADVTGLRQTAQVNPVVQVLVLYN